MSELTRVRNRWTRYDLIVIDELGYVVMPDTAAELLFQVIAGRAERAAVIVTTNLPFSEWTTKFPNARLCKAMLDRLTDQAHIIETGKDSYRFLRTLDRSKAKERKHEDAAVVLRASRWAEMVGGQQGFATGRRRSTFFAVKTARRHSGGRWRSATKASAATTKGGGGWKAGWPRL